VISCFYTGFFSGCCDSSKLYLQRVGQFSNKMEDTNEVLISENHHKVSTEFFGNLSRRPGCRNKGKKGRKEKKFLRVERKKEKGQEEWKIVITLYRMCHEP